MVIDASTLIYQITNDFLNKTLSASYPVIDKKGKIKLYSVSYEDEEELELRHNNYKSDLFVITHSSGQHKTKVWLAEGLNYTPIKIEVYRKNKLKSKLVMIEDD